AQSQDRATAHLIEHFDGDRIGPEQACGCIPLGGMLRAAKTRGLHIARVDLRNSGDTAGPRDRVVGYGAWALSSWWTRRPPEPTKRWRGRTVRRSYAAPQAPSVTASTMAGRRPSTLHTFRPNWIFPARPSSRSRRTAN